MGVYKRKLSKGIRYFFSGQYKGQKYFSRATYLTKTDCQKAEREHLQKLDTEVQKNPGNLSIFQLITSRLDELKNNKSKSYYKESKRYFKLLLDYTGNVPVTDITKVQVNHISQTLARYLKARGKTNHKANACLRSLKALFNFGIVIYDIEMRNPCLGIKMLPVDIKLKYIPPDEEIRAVKEHCDREEAFLIDFVDQTGCRINEAVRLTYEDIEGDLLTLWTHKAKNSNLTPRRIPIPLCLKDKKKGNGKVFKRWVSLPRFLSDKITELGFKKWGFHNLRHRRASLWAKEGRTLLEIMQLLGHSNLSTTQKYLQILGHIKL
ncbi:MAG: site-specific integrase [Candidatus Latescibacterota bacterium]